MICELGDIFLGPSCVHTFFSILGPSGVHIYTIGSLNGDWERLRDKFCLAFFPISRITSLRKEIHGF
jgi:hypothetical protein